MWETLKVEVGQGKGNHLRRGGKVCKMDSNLRNLYFQQAMVRKWEKQRKGNGDKGQRRNWDTNTKDLVERCSRKTEKSSIKKNQ